MEYQFSLFIMNLVRKQMKNLGGQDIQSKKQEKKAASARVLFKSLPPLL